MCKGSLTDAGESVLTEQKKLTRVKYNGFEELQSTRA